MNTKELIAEANAHIAYTLDGIGPDDSEVRAVWARGEGSDDRFALVVRLSRALAAVSDTPQEVGKRLIPEFRASLVDAAALAIQDVWNDVPAGVDAVTLAHNVVAAQEFFWLSRAFPVHAVSDTTPSEPTARVVPVSYEASASCSQGACPTGCSHLMWECKVCSCEGGWGASRERLEELASQHVCVAVAPTPSEWEREALIEEGIRIGRAEGLKMAARAAGRTEAARLTPPAPVDREKLVAFYRTQTRIHEPVATEIAEAYADRLLAEFPALAVSPTPARDEWEQSYEYAKRDSVDGFMCQCTFGGCKDDTHRREVLRGPWEPLPVTEEESDE